MGMVINKDKFDFIISEQSSYYSVRFDVALKEGGVAQFTYMATPEPHLFNYATLETILCKDSEKVARIADEAAFVTILKSCTMEQEIRRRMRLMDRLLADNGVAVKIGENVYRSLACGGVMLNDDIDNHATVAEMTNELFNLNEHVVREEE